MWNKRAKMWENKSFTTKVIGLICATTSLLQSIAMIINCTTKTTSEATSVTFCCPKVADFPKSDSVRVRNWYNIPVMWVQYSTGLTVRWYEFKNTLYDIGNSCIVTFGGGAIFWFDQVKLLNKIKHLQIKRPPSLSVLLMKLSTLIQVRPMLLWFTIIYKSTITLWKFLR